MATRQTSKQEISYVDFMYEQSRTHTRVMLARDCVYKLRDRCTTQKLRG